MSINRVVALLTPLVFAPLSGACAAWLADHFPGVEVSPAQVQQIFIAGALIALAPALQWLHGWQKYEARLAEADAIERTNADPASAVAGEEPELAPGDPDGDEFDDGEFDLEFEDDAAVNGQPVASGA